jgi:hypothetical protein
MSASISDVLAGGVMNTPPSIPLGMLHREKKYMGVLKQTLKIVHFFYQITAKNGQ